MEPCLQKIQSLNEVHGVVAYADDILILINGNTRAQLENKCNKVVQELDIWCVENKLKLSQEKTVYMLLKGNLKRNPSIKIGGTNIKRTKTTKYLGIVLDEKLNFHQHITYTCEKSNKIMNKIISIGQRKFHLPLTVIRSYHESILTSIMAYGASIWAHRLQVKANAAAIERVQRNVLIRLSGAYRTTAKSSLLVALGIPPMHLTIQKRAAIYSLKKGKIGISRNIIQEPVNSIHDIKECILNKWQNLWDSSETGRRTHGFFPDIRERLKLKYINPKEGSLHYLTGHGPYQDTLHRIGIVDSPYCECGPIIATPEHVIFECQRTRHYRPDIRAILANRYAYDILRVEELYGLLDELTAQISRHHREEYRRRMNQMQ